MKFKQAEVACASHHVIFKGRQQSFLLNKHIYVYSLYFSHKLVTTMLFGTLLPTTVSKTA